MPKRDTRRKTIRDTPVHQSSGNVFEDLDVAESAQALVKAELAARISEAIARRRLTQAEAAKLLGVDQPTISDLMRGRLKGFSSDRLFRFLNALGKEIEIVIRPRRRSSSKPSIHVVEAG